MVHTRPSRAVPARVLRERVDGIEIPPNFSFAKGLGLGWTQDRENRDEESLSCVAKKRSIGGDGA